jgi:drug/metabolite transporter (DMT)-like permease
MAYSASILSSPIRRLTTAPLPLLLIVGFFLAVSILLSKVAAAQGAPMLTYLALAMGGSGLILTLSTRRTGTAETGILAIAFYSLGAGGLMALGSALGYLTVHKVGAAFIALALAFPPMLTWLLSMVLGMERFDTLRLAGLLIGLGGGVFLAVSKGIGAPSDFGAILTACSMPIVLAVGNVFRTRYWPKGARPGRLAGAMLICGAGLTLPFAVAMDGAPAIAALAQPTMLVVLLFALVTFVAQYLALFQLQRVAGPVYLSQIGSVAAIIGSPVAVFALGERLPEGFAFAGLLIVLGITLFQFGGTRRAAEGRRP